MATAAGFSTAFLGNQIKGESLISVLICLSQAPQNGWETWYSLWYGSKMAGLKVAVPQVENISFTKALKRAQKEVVDTAANADPKRPPTKNTNAYVEYH